MELAERNAVTRVMASYFEGLHRADPAVLREVFHEDLAYVNATDAAYASKNLDEYLADVAGRSPSPPKCEPKIEQIKQIDDNLAFVHATMSLMNRDYRDALTLIKAHGQWKIISKVFVFAEQGEG